MPRKNKNARSIPRRRRTKVYPNVRLIHAKDDRMSPGRLVAAAEYVPIKVQDGLTEVAI